MGHREDRRDFIGVLGAGGAAATLLAMGPFAKGDPPRDEKGRGGDTYTGETDFEDSGDVLTAIRDALLKAIEAAKLGIGSTLVVWSMVELSCASGGFAQNHIARVTIRAREPNAQERSAQPERPPEQQRPPAGRSAK